MIDKRKIGLARALSKMGYCSRSQAADLIRSGRVQINGRVVRDPETPTRIPHDKLVIDGSPVARRESVYLVMNKPRGVVTTASDEKGRATVYDLLPEQNDWVGPVGRLDKASEGLLLLTNDSEWAARITYPATHVAKCYHVQVNCLAQADLVSRLSKGVVVDGERLSVKSVRVLRSGAKNSWLEVVLDEGKNRQIRRLLNTIGVEVLRLVRVSIGPLQLGNLQKGKVRPLTAEEKLWLDRSLQQGQRIRPKKTTGARR